MNESQQQWITDNVPAWIDSDIDLDQIQAINQGGCESGAYMPAVTYHEALKTIHDHGDDVLDYLEYLGEPITPPAESSWGQITSFYLACAVELRASSAEDELVELEDGQ